MTSSIADVGMNDIDGIMGRVRDRDAIAFATLFDAYHRLVFVVAVRIIGDHCAAEDITQNVFMKVWANPAAFRSGSFAAWISRVTRNCAIDERRRRVNTEPYDGDPPTAIHGDVFEQLDATMVRESLSTLSDKQRSVIDLNFFGEMTHEQISACTGIPLGTVKTRIRAGLHRLRERYVASPAI